MRVEVSVPEIVTLFKEIQTQPEKVFENDSTGCARDGGKYLTEMMNAELSQFLGREPYERKAEESNPPQWLL